MLGPSENSERRIYYSSIEQAAGQTKLMALLGGGRIAVKSRGQSRSVAGGTTKNVMENFPCYGKISVQVGVSRHLETRSPGSSNRSWEIQKKKRRMTGKKRRRVGKGV